ncbi:MAG: hypothetical protein R2706_08215 [Acidimicrobiales bacterium]
MTSPELLANVAARSDQLMTVRAIADTTGIFGDIRGMGLLVGAELAEAHRDTSQGCTGCGAGGRRHHARGRYQRRSLRPGPHDRRG